VSLNKRQINLLQRTLDHRKPLIDPQHRSALRLLNGFYEGIPDLLVDLYGSTLVFYNYADPAQKAQTILDDLQYWYRSELPWVKSILVKTRISPDPEARRGNIIYGNQLEKSITENDIRYALDLRVNQDASFYIDTRALRSWLHTNMAGKTILNTFAYTGSLGVAALAGGAAKVIQTDINPRFLGLAKKSCALNHIAIRQSDFFALDFYKMVNRFKTNQTLFDCVIIDPPFFSVSSAGKVDLVNESKRLINKVRPLIAHDGWLITINNALFVSGAEVMSQLQELCQGVYLNFKEIIPVPEDVTGFEDTKVKTPPTDPTPFNHPTKIAILRVSRKDGKRASQ